MASGPPGTGLPEIQPLEFVLTAQFTTPAGNVLLEIGPENSPDEYAGQLWISGSPKLAWKRSEDEPFGFMISSLDIEFALDPNSPGASSIAWPGILQEPDYGRWRVELRVDNAIRWRGYILPLSLTWQERDNLRFVKVTAGDGLATLKSAQLPYKPPKSYIGLQDWLNSVISLNFLSPPVLDSSSWRFIPVGGQTPYYDLVDLYFDEHGFVDPQTGELPTIYEALHELATRLMLTISHVDGNIYVDDLLGRPFSLPAPTRDDIKFSQADYWTDIIITNPFEFPAGDENKDPQITSWENDIDYAREWAVPWAVASDGTIDGAKYVTVAERIDNSNGGLRQLNGPNHELEQRALVEQEAIRLKSIQDGMFIRVVFDVTANWQRQAYNPFGSPLITLIPGIFKFVIRCGSYWYDISSGQWDTAEVINDSPYDDGREFAILITKMPPEPATVIVQVRNPVGQWRLPTIYDTPELAVDNEIRSIQVTTGVLWLRFGVLLAHPEDLEYKVSPPAGFYYATTKKFQFLFSVKHLNAGLGSSIKLSIHYPDCRSLAIPGSYGIATVTRTDFDGQGITSQNMDEVYGRVLMARYGGIAPKHIAETTFFGKFISPREVIGDNGKLLRLPIEVTWDIVAGTSTGRWEIDYD